MAPDAKAKGEDTVSETSAGRNEARATWFAWVGLLAAAVVVIGAGFALTFHGIYGFGRDIAKWGPVLSAFGPIADDGLTLVAIAATFLLAHVHAPRRPRAYAWFVFAVSCAASIAGNTAYALRPLPMWAGAIGAAMCPVFVTLAAHLGVVCWRHWRVFGVGAGTAYQHMVAGVLVGSDDEICTNPGGFIAEETTSRPRPAAQPASTSPPPAGQTHPTARKENKQVNAEKAAPALPGGQRRGGRRASPAQKIQALQLVDAGTTPPKAAKIVGVSPRTVQLWVQEPKGQPSAINGARVDGGGHGADDEGSGQA